MPRLASRRPKRVAAVTSRPALKNHYEAASKEVQDYFPHLPALLAAFPLQVALAYVFSRVELAQNMALYCGIVKCHKGDAALSWHAVDSHPMTRKYVVEKYALIFGEPSSPATSPAIRAAEKVRDNVMHGKNASDKEVRQAISCVLDYAQLLNADVSSVAGFKPFGNLRGFKGATQSLAPSTTRWILKGMGFSVS